jgi:hypothetical protein
MDLAKRIALMTHRGLVALAVVLLLPGSLVAQQETG